MAHEMIEEGKLWSMICSVLQYSNLATETRNIAKRPGDLTTTAIITTATPDDHTAPYTSSNATKTNDRQQYKRQSETRLEGDLNRQKTYDFENPKLPTPAVTKCLTETPDDQPAPCTQSNATTTDVRQQYKRQSETQLKGDFKRQKTSDFENPKLQTPAATHCPTGQGSTQEQSTTNRQTTPTTTSSPDLRQHLKRPPDILVRVKGDPKRHKTPYIEMKTPPGTL